jgi:hypothetical protein
MSYDEVEIEDMKWDEQLQAYTYSCPCGDLFQITLVSHTFCCCLCECSGFAGLVWGRVAGRVCTGLQAHVFLQVMVVLTCCNCCAICPAGAVKGWRGDRQVPQLLLVHNSHL